MARILLNANSTTSSPSTKSAIAEPPLPNSAESDFVVILAALLCALICVVGLISVVRCAWLRGRNGNGRFGTQPSANRGLKKKVVQSLPKYVFDSSSIDVEKSAGGGASDSTSDCAICLMDYADGDEIRVLPQCGHRFHVQCIDTWLGSHSSCPSCRQILVVARCHKCGEFPTVSGVCPQLPPPTGVPFKARLDFGLPSSSSSNSSTFLP